MRSTLELLGATARLRAIGAAVLATALGLALLPAIHAQAQAAEPKIAFVNPSSGYGYTDPAGEDDPPKISDKNDGVDQRYHIVAGTENAPSDAVVEVTIKFALGNEITIGTLDRVSGAPNTWDLFWDIPNNMQEGTATMTARLFKPDGADFEQIAEHQQPVDVQHRSDGPPDTQEADETVEITFPDQNGQLGFYKPVGGAWRTQLDGMASDFTQRVDIFYSTSKYGAAMTFKSCSATLNTQNHDNFAVEPIPWSGTCTLTGSDTPSKVTTVAAVAKETDNPIGGLLTQDSADAHRVRPFQQIPSQMSISITPAVARVVVHASSGTACQRLEAVVRDPLGRPISGVNVDTHIKGPNDQVQFGTFPAQSTQPQSTAFKAPDQGGHKSELAANCPNANQTNNQGDHNIAGADDVKHIETTSGTSSAGLFRFYVVSRQAIGFTDVTSFIDDEALPREADPRPLDSDTIDPGEKQDTARVQHMPQSISVTIAPNSDSAPAGSCNAFTARVRSGSVAVPNINVDVHGLGPSPDLDFCSPSGASPRRAPDVGDHTPEEPDEASHGDGTQHTEGETDSNGNFLFGIQSPAPGDTTLTAWVDGEPGADNDVQSGEPSGTATNSWSSSAGDAEISWVNPSGYGSGAGDRISDKLDSDDVYHLVARVDAPTLIQGVEFLISPGTTNTFTKIGDATRVGGSDTYEMAWDVNVADGSYVLRARVAGTNQQQDRTVTVNRTTVDAMDQADETAEMSQPVDAATATFLNRGTPVQGTGSAGAERVDFYYTKTAARDRRDSAQWIACGSDTLDGTGADPQPFSGTCTLTGLDQPGSVTGIAVASVDCNPAGCQVGLTRESGDAHRVFGVEAEPLLSISPTAATRVINTCAKFTLTVTDQTGQPISAANIDVHALGPQDTTNFCSPSGASPRRAPDQGVHVPREEDEAVHSDPDGPDLVHTEGETNPNGRFVFGVRSAAVNNTSLDLWFDTTDNDVKSDDENSAHAEIQWVNPGACTIRGTSGNDRLTGTAGPDKICGLGGDDEIVGGSGNDNILGGRGRDDIRGNRGADRVDGGDARDVIRGGADRDVLLGRLAGDTITGGASDDKLYGHQGNDNLNGGRGRDDCFPGPGDDDVTRCEN